LKNGSGDKIGDIARVKDVISKMRAEDLKALHNLMFRRPGMRRNMTLLNGFSFAMDSDASQKMLLKLQKC